MQDLVIFDLSGTLVKPVPRPSDLEAYAASISTDVINASVAAVFYDHFMASRDMWVVSTRKEEVREPTEDWLYHQGIYYNKLLMRPAGDMRDAIDIKLRWLHDGTIPRERVLCVYEDDPAMIQMYQGEGITCFHVLPGDH
jgi:hypothetical protein